MQANAIPDHAVSEALGVLLKHQSIIQTKDGQLVNPERWEKLAPLQQLAFRETRINLAVNSFLNGVGRHLATLHHQRNNLPPIHRLPNEILTFIFEELVEDRFACRGSYDVVVKLLQVSSQWRSIALSTTRLWTHIDSRYCKSLVIASITRSRNTPLHLFISDPKVGREDEEAFFELTSPHMARWETFKCDSGHILDRLAHLEGTDSKMSLLRRFEVRGRWVGDKQIPHVVSHNAPRLLSLDIMQFFFPEVAPSFSGLQEIRFLAVTKDGPWSPEQWHTLLASCPELESIYAKGFALDFEIPVTPFQVSLPRLKSFALQGFDSWMVSLLLSSISSNEDDPPSLDIDESWEDDRDRNLSQTTFPQSSIASTLLSSIHRVTTVNAEFSGTELTLKSGTDSKKNLLGYQGKGDWRPPLKIFRILTPPSMWPNLKELDLTGSPLFQDESFLPTLYSCTLLERLSIRYPDPEGQIDNHKRITRWLGVGTATQTGQRILFSRPFPNLKYLGFRIRDTGVQHVASLMAVRYGNGLEDVSGDFGGHLVTHGDLVKLEELRLSISTSTSDFSGLNPFILMIRCILHPFGTMVRIVDGRDFYRRDLPI